MQDAQRVTTAHASYPSVHSNYRVNSRSLLEHKAPRYMQMSTGYNDKEKRSFPGAQKETRMRRHSGPSLKRLRAMNSENGNIDRAGSRGCYRRPYSQINTVMHQSLHIQILTRPLDPPTASRCLPSQLLGASLRRCRTTVLLCRRMVMSYHAEVMSLFSRRRFSTSC